MTQEEQQWFELYLKADRKNQIISEILLLISELIKEVEKDGRS